MAGEMQRGQLDISEFCSIRAAERERQLEGERVEQSKREMDNCTFHPKIITRFRY